MKLFQKYIFSGLSFVTLGISFILTVVLWIAQSLRFGKMIVYCGSSLMTLGWLMLSVLPSILMIAVPCGFLCALCWRYHALIRDNERTVVSACGVSQRFFMYPSLGLSGILTLFLYSLSLYVNPVMQQKKRDTQQALSYSLAPALLAPGLFLKMGGYTLYAHKQISSSEFEGVLLHDDRSKTQKEIITGEKATILQHKQGLRLTLQNGTYQRIFPNSSKPPAILSFRQYVMDILPKTSKNRPITVQELDTRQLWTHIHYPGQEENILSYTQELHRRILLPLVPIFYGMWIPFVFLLYPFSRGPRYGPFLWVLGGIAVVQGFLALALTSSVWLVWALAYGLITVPGILWIYTGWTQK